MKQQTIGNCIKAKGYGRENNQPSMMCLRPAIADSGIIFHKKSALHTTIIPADLEHACVIDGLLSFSNQGQTIRGAETLLAACYGLGIHNLIVEVSAPEIPKLTDSAAGYTFLLQSAGRQQQEIPRRQIKLDEPRLYRQGSRWIRVNEFNHLRVACIDTLNESAVSVQRSSTVVDVSEAIFVSELCHAQSTACISQQESTISKIAARNLRNQIQRSQLNYLVVEVLAMLALTNAQVNGCYTAFDADIELHLESVRSLYKESLQREAQGEKLKAVGGVGR